MCLIARLSAKSHLTKRELHAPMVFGGNAFFDTEAAKGGVSKIYGSVTVETDHRDSIFVKAFECVKG
jgi:hypothetical protein